MILGYNVRGPTQPFLNFTYLMTNTLATNQVDRPFARAHSLQLANLSHLSLFFLASSARVAIFISSSTFRPCYGAVI